MWSRNLFYSHTVLRMGTLGPKGFEFYISFVISKGFKRRMKLLAKQRSFYFLQNVWKCTGFWAYAFKICKNCLYDPKILFSTKIQYGVPKNAEFYVDSKFVEMAKILFRKKVIGKKRCESFFRFLHFLTMFFKYNFFRNIILSHCTKVGICIIIQV